MKSMPSSRCVRSIPRSGWISRRRGTETRSKGFQRGESRQVCPAPGIVSLMARKSSQPRSSRGKPVASSLPDTLPFAARSAALEIYDTTLRDGAQAEDVTFSAEDKVRVAQQLDGLGIQFIEGGWPGANPKDIEFFRMIKTVPVQTATVVAFGSTRKA